MSEQEWTTTPPTKEGWYWVSSDGQRIAHNPRWYFKTSEGFRGTNKAIDKVWKYWYGPLSQPEPPSPK